jgi:hypothetical protein
MKYILDRQSHALDLIDARERQALDQKYLRMERIKQRNRQSRTVQKIMELTENLGDITAPIQKTESAQKKISDKKSIKNGRWQEKLQELRKNSGDLTAVSTRKAGAPLPRQDGRCNKFFLQ